MGSATQIPDKIGYVGSLCLRFLTTALSYFTLVAPRILRMVFDTWKIFVAMTVDKRYLLI